MAIVRAEIESWHLAGAGNAAARQPGFGYKRGRHEFDELAWKIQSRIRLETL